MNQPIPQTWPPPVRRQLGAGVLVDGLLVTWMLLLVPRLAKQSLAHVDHVAQYVHYLNKAAFLGQLVSGVAFVLALIVGIVSTATSSRHGPLVCLVWIVVLLGGDGTMVYYLVTSNSRATAGLVALIMVAVYVAARGMLSIRSAD